MTRNNQLSAIYVTYQKLLQNVPSSRYSATDRHNVTTAERVYLAVLQTVPEVDCRCFVLMLELGECGRAKEWPELGHYTLPYAFGACALRHVSAYYLGSHKMKGTARVLFTVATRHRMCYEIICDHIHNIVDHIHNSADHVTCTTLYYKQKRHES